MVQFDKEIVKYPASGKPTGSSSFLELAAPVDRTAVRLSARTAPKNTLERIKATLLPHVRLT
jgi:hypothetical protein